MSIKFSCTKDYIFHTIQGEGRYAGVPSIFLRLSGCNLRCRWRDPSSGVENLCDTPYSSHQPEKEVKTQEEILRDLLAIDCRHIVITGGEPFLQKALAGLVEALEKAGRYVTIETNASIYFATDASFISMSPKLSSSSVSTEMEGVEHHKKRWRPEHILEFCLHHDYQLKFVLNDPKELEEIFTLLEFLEANGVKNPKEKTYLMPQAIHEVELQERSLALIDLCKEHGFSFCDRLHIRIWGSKRGV